MTTYETPVDGETHECDAVVIGAGFGGLYATWRLTEMGLSVRSFEAADDVGGVWQHNRYPGAQTDSPQEAYRLSFDGDPLAEWLPRRRFPSQPEVLGYLGHIADRFELRRHYSFSTRVVSAHFDAAQAFWTVTTDAGQRYSTRYVITAIGAVSEPLRPGLPNFDSFEGEVYYTNRWPRGEVALAGKRIGLIGTGSSGVQIMPHLARAASELTVFQRTANYVLPTGNRDLTDADRAELRDRFDDVRRRVRGHHAGFPFESRVGRSAIESGAAERARVFEESWVRGGFSFLYEGFDDLEEDELANAMASDFLRSKIRSIVNDPEVAEELVPDHPYGTKRPPTGDAYYQSFNEPHVHLVNVRKSPIETFTPTGVRVDGRSIDLDVVVMATGFDIGVGAYSRIDIRGIDGVLLRDHWANGPSTLLGIAVSGFPNLFMVSGPHSAFANVPPGAQHEGDWIAEFISYIERHSMHYMDVDPVAENRWNQHVVEAAGDEFIRDAIKANSWLVGANVDGRDPVVTVYLGGHDAYLDQLDAEAAAEYPSFVRGPADREDD